PQPSPPSFRRCRGHLSARVRNAKLGTPDASGRHPRTFSDCTNAPRLGLVSGCYPLDSFYKGRAEAKQLQAKKVELRRPPPNPLLR
ncbi:MAG: hypothetical protein WCD04_19350, partial [Terriglobia bacterium]